MNDHNKALAHHEKVLRAKRAFLDKREVAIRAVVSNFAKATTKTDENKYRKELKALLKWEHPKFPKDTRAKHVKLESQARQNLERLQSEFRGRFSSYRDQLETYTKLFIHRGPRYLKQVTIKLNDDVHYLGRYDPVPDPAANPSFNINKMRAELARIYAVIDERERSRLKAVADLTAMHFEIAKFTNDFSSAIWNTAVMSTIVEATGVVVEAVVTGGGSVAVQGATKLAEGAKGSKVFETAVEEVTNTAMALRRKIRSAGSKLTLIASGKLQATAIVNGLELYGSASEKAFHSTLIGDSIEIAVSTAAAGLQDFIANYKGPATGAWSAIEAGKAPVAGRVKLTNLKGTLEPSGIGATLAVSVGKAIVNSMLAVELDFKKWRFYETVAQSGYLIQMLDVHRAVDRDIEKIRRQYEIAIRDYEYRQKILDRNTSLELQRTVDKAFEDVEATNALDRFVDVEIDLRFSQTLEHPPSLTFAGTQATTFERLDGAHRSTTWRTKMKFTKSFFSDALNAGVETLPLEVSIDKRENYTALDQKPETLALPKVFNEDWRFYEAGIDRNHRLKVRDMLDLSGRWIITGGSGATNTFDHYVSSYTFRIHHDKENLEIRYDAIPDVIRALCKHPANKTLSCIEKGDLFLKAKIGKDKTPDGYVKLTGEAYLGRRVKACGSESGTPVTMVVAKNEQAIAGFLQAAFDPAAYAKPLTACPIKPTSTPVSIRLLEPSQNRFTMVRRGTPYAESILKNWHTLFSGMKGNPKQAASGFAGGFSFIGTGMREERQDGGNGLVVVIPRQVTMPNDGSQSAFWEVESFADVAAAENVSLTLNAEETIRSEKYARGEITSEPGFGQTAFEATTEGAKAQLRSLGIESRQDLERVRALFKQQTGQDQAAPIPPPGTVKPFTPVEPPKPLIEPLPAPEPIPLIVNPQ
ncbi:MAG: hypothetical protein AAGE61_07285 [Pseudomonadota bacterium]